MTTKFFTRNGWLTPYAMACGYIHRTNNVNGRDIVFTMINQDLPLYEVEVLTKDDKGHLLGCAYRNTFESIECARKVYRKHVGELQMRFEKNPEVNRLVIV